MSHSITINASNLAHHISICDNFLERLNGYKKKVEGTQYFNFFDFSNLEKSIDNLKKEINLNIGKKIRSEEMHNLLSSLSHVEKEVANIEFVFEQKKDKIINEILDIKDFKISEYVQNYGSLAIDAIEYLESINEPISSESLDKAIQSIRNNNLNDAKRKEFLDFAFKYIDETDLPNDMKYNLKKEIRDLKTSQEISDVIPLIESKCNEYKRFKILVNDFNNSLKEQGFKVDKNIKGQMSVDDYSNMVYKYRLINDNNNKVDIIINSEGKIRYKLGNYEGHMCNKTTEILFKKMKEQGYNLEVVSIKRDIHNSKPLEMEKELK